MKVLLVGNTESAHVQRWAAALAAAELEVASVGFAPLPGLPAVDQHVLPGGGRGDDRYLRALPALRRAIQRFDPDVVHAHFVSSYGLMALLAAGRRPVVQFAWGTDLLAPEDLNRPQWALVAVALRRAAAVVVDSSDVAAVVRRRARREPATVVFGPPASWTEAPRHPSSSILSPRGLLPLYNASDVVTAFTAIAPQMTPWHLDVLTAGADHRELETAVARAGLANRVSWWPFLSRSEVQERYLRAEIMCSVPSRDATSVCVLEAMASGTFPIVSDLPANRGLVTDGENGLLVPVRDPSALSRAFVRAAQDHELRARALVRNRAFVAETATWERAVGQVVALTASVAR